MYHVKWFETNSQMSIKNVTPNVAKKLVGVMVYTGNSSNTVKLLQLTFYNFKV